MECQSPAPPFNPPISPAQWQDWADLVKAAFTPKAPDETVERLKVSRHLVVVIRTCPAGMFVKLELVS